MIYEIVKKELFTNYSNDNSIHFLKWHYSDTEKLNDFKEKIKITKSYEIDLKGNTESELDIETLSGIIPENELNKTVQKLLPYSFILQVKIKLTSPYFSHDDDDFYLIQNPCLKEKVYKVPMVRGSGWKGAIARAGKELVENKISNIISYARIFGLGSDEFRKLFDSLERKKESMMSDIFRFLLFELGVKLIKDKLEKNKVVKFLKEKTIATLEREKGKYAFVQVHKGRAIFYPTYFNRLSLEIINPHNRKTRAGTNPIHYEVVPKETAGTLQIIYIPFDAVLSKDEDTKKQVKKDIEFLTKCVEKVAGIGIGAKEKLGWGRFEIIDKKIIRKKEVRL